MSDEAHPDVVKRLKRANGHLETIIEMIGEGRPPAQLAQQLEAVERAIERNAKKALIRTTSLRRWSARLRSLAQRHAQRCGSSRRSRSIFEGGLTTSSRPG